MNSLALKCQLMGLQERVSRVCSWLTCPSLKGPLVSVPCYAALFGAQLPAHLSSPRPVQEVGALNRCTKSSSTFLPGGTLAIPGELSCLLPTGSSRSSARDNDGGQPGRREHRGRSPTGGPLSPRPIRVEVMAVGSVVCLQCPERLPAGDLESPNSVPKGGGSCLRYKETRQCPE